MNTLNRRIIITTALYVVLIAVGAFFVIRPMMERVQLQQLDLQNEYQKYKSAQLKLQQLTNLTQTRQDVETAKALTAKAIPPTLDQDRLILSLEKVVSDTSLILSSLTVSSSKGVTAAAPAKKIATSGAKALDKLSSIPVTLVVDGSYDNTLKLLDTLEKLDRILSIESVSVSNATSSDANGGSIETSIQITGYALGDTL